MEKKKKKKLKKLWKTIQYEFKTVLGTSSVLVEVWDTKEGIFFRPGEEKRLEKAQAEKFMLSLILDNKKEPTEFQIAHLKRVLKSD